MMYIPIIQNRKFIRLQGYDYSQPGEYFITSCTQDRECVLGKVVDGNLQINKTGKNIARCWTEILQDCHQSEIHYWSLVEHLKQP